MQASGVKKSSTVLLGCGPYIVHYQPARLTMSTVLIGPEANLQERAHELNTTNLVKKPETGDHRPSRDKLYLSGHLPNVYITVFIC